MGSARFDLARGGRHALARTGSGGGDGASRLFGSTTTGRIRLFRCTFRYPDRTKRLLYTGMAPPSVYPKYSDVEARYENRRRRVLADFPWLEFYMEECIRFSHGFNNEMSSFINENVKSDLNDSLYKRTAIVHSLYSRNNLYLRSAYGSVLDGYASTPAAMLRAVYEAVLAQYWVSLCEDEDVGEYWKRSMPPPRVPSFSDLKRKLYVGENLARAGHAYNRLSAYAHPNPRALDLKYDRDQMHGVIELMFTLSLFNTLSYSQLYSHFEASTTNMVGKNTDMFVKEMLHRGNYKLDVMLFPNRPEFATRLAWSPSVDTLGA